MASVNWQKQTKQKASAMKKHNGQQERLRYQHDNPDIDKSLTPNNYCIGCEDYTEAYKHMVQRVAEVDKESPPAKVTADRKICCSLETPCPLEITQAGRSEEFFHLIHDVMVEFFGKENVHGACVHLDEVHDYIDEQTGETKQSLEHSTELVSCYAEWQEPVWERDQFGKIKTEPVMGKDGKPLLDKDGNQRVKKIQAHDEQGEPLYIERKGINGKHFETKAALIELNDTVCGAVRARFGIEFNTGEQARHKTAETLKAHTAERAAKQAAERARAEAERMQEQALAYEPPKRRPLEGKRAYEERIAIQQQAVAVKQRGQAIDERVAHEEQRITEKKREINAAAAAYRKEFDEKEKALDQREASIDREVARRCEERLARSDKYARYRVNQQHSQAYQQRLQAVLKTAEERSKNESKTIGTEQDRGLRTKPKQDQRGR